MLSDLIRMSLRSLQRRRLRSWLTMLGIFIGILAVVTLISLGQGLEEVVIGQFSIAGADAILVQAKGVQMGPPGTGVVNPLSEEDLKATNRVSGVDYTVGRIIKSARVEFNDETEMILIVSASEDANRFANLETTKGRLLKSSDRKKVVVGSEFESEDRFGKPIVIGSRLIISGEEFEVVGILKKKGSFVTDTTINMPTEDMQELFDTEDYSAIGVKIKQGADVQEVKSDLEKELRKSRDVKIDEEDFSVETSESALEGLTSTLFGVQLFVYIIAVISIIVGGIGIMNTMYTSVLERTRDIGIMKAIGAKNRTIFTLFFIESGLLGLVGGGAGVIIGSLVAKGAAFAGRVALGTDLLQAQISPMLIIGALLFSFVIGIVSGIVPAMKASKMSPVDALRG